MTAALIIYQRFVAVCRNVETWKENSLMLILHLRGWADAKKRERESHEPVPLQSFLPWICPRAAFHPHHRSSDGTFLPPPLLVFSLPAPALPPIHTFSSLFNLSRFLPQFVSPFLAHSLFVIPELCLSLSAIFALFSSSPSHPHTVFSDGKHIFSNFSACVCISPAQNSEGHIWGFKSFHCQIVLLFDLCLVKHPLVNLI